MEYLLIDAGGTSTKVYFYDGKEISKEHRFPPASVATVGIHNSVSRLTNIISSFNRKFDGIAISLAGIDTNTIARQVKGILYRNLSDYSDKVIIEHDAHVVLLSNAPTGCIVISGTGSIVYGYDGKKKIIKGDRGWLVGDICSGFWLGREFLRYVLNEFQGLSRRSLIPYSNFKNEEELVRFLYENSCDQAKIANFSNNLLKAVENNNRKAINILSSCISSLSSIVRVVCNSVHSNTVYYFGGMINSEIYTSFFTREVEKRGIKGVKSKNVVNGLINLLKL
ncbi:ATPase [Sulfolobus sp. A20-N-G8]|nr:ATPase [Sulfolobus sp. A20-N-G8]